MSLLLNMLSGIVTTFLAKSKHLLIFWLQSLSAVILEPKKRKSVTVSGSGLFSLPAKKLAIFSRMAAPFYISPSSSVVKNPPAMEEMQVRSLSWKNPLEEEMAILSSILAWRIPWREEPGGLQCTESQRVGRD